MLDFSSITTSPFPPLSVYCYLLWPRLVLFLSFHMFMIGKISFHLFLNFLYHSLFSAFSFLAAFFIRLLFSPFISDPVIFFPILKTFHFFFFFFFFFVVSMPILCSLVLLKLSLSSLDLHFP